MAKPDDTPSMAVFCDFENVALGVRDAKYEKFDIRKVLERLLLKGSIVVKKAYCDWARYREFKAEMHEASFELIEIPHVRQSGKNSADIRMVVDALDLCYTKSHVDTFVIVSGDSDFSPLVSKLRENAKTVIGVGVKGSTSDLLTANCDEFIYSDDLVREQRRRGAQTAARREGARGEGGRGENGRGENGRGEGGRGDSGRGGGRGPGRGGERDPAREAVRPPPPVAPAIGGATPADDDVGGSVGGPWRPFAPERRDPAVLASGDTPSTDADPGADDAGGRDAAAEAIATAGAAALDATRGGEVGEGDDAPPATPARRSRRGRGRAAAAAPEAAIDPSDAVSAADFAAADGPDASGSPSADAGPDPLDGPSSSDALAEAAEPEAPPAPGPKKRAPRRRKAAALDDAAAASAHAEPAPTEDRPDAAPRSPSADVVPAPGADAPDAGAPADDDGAPRPRRSEAERRQEAIDLAVETVEALLAERGADDKIWGSMVKQTLKRRRPGFAESYYGYRSFNELLEDARDRGLLALEHDEKSGGYVIRLL